MKNITVSVDEEIYRQARIAAAERNTSVSALVKRCLEDLTGREQYRALQQESLIRIFAIADKRARDNPPIGKLDREVIYDRGFRRY